MAWQLLLYPGGPGGFVPKEGGRGSRVTQKGGNVPKGVVGGSGVTQPSPTCRGSEGP